MCQENDTLSSFCCPPSSIPRFHFLPTTTFPTPSPLTPVRHKSSAFLDSLPNPPHPLSPSSQLQLQLQLPHRTLSKQQDRTRARTGSRVEEASQTNSQPVRQPARQMNNNTYRCSSPSSLNSQALAPQQWAFVGLRRTSYEVEST